MMWSDNSGHSFEVVLGEAATTQLPWTLDYTDTAADGSSVTLATTSGTTNSTTDVSLIAGPSSGVRGVNHFSLVNVDNVQHGVTIKKDEGGGTERKIVVATLAVGDTLYFDGERWYVLNSSGKLKVA